METIVMVMDRDADWPRVWGPFPTFEEAQKWAEETFPRAVWCTAERTPHPNPIYSDAPDEWV